MGLAKNKIKHTVFKIRTDWIFVFWDERGCNGNEIHVFELDLQDANVIRKAWLTSILRIFGYVFNYRTLTYVCWIWSGISFSSGSRRLQGGSRATKNFDSNL